MEGYQDKEFGVVLEGGGARGAYQIGAWRALNELDIKVTAIVGTSVGALNGALMAQGEYERAYQLWNNIKYSHVMNVDDLLFEKLLKLDFGKEDLGEIKKLLKKLKTDLGIDVEPLKALIRDILDEEKIRNSGCHYGLVTFNVTDMKPMEIFIDEIEEGQLPDLLLASSYLPVFKRERLHGKQYLDGGFYNNLPVKMLIAKGYKNIISIRLGSFANVQKFALTDDIEYINIQPSEYLGNILEFSPQNVSHNLELGYYDTLRVFKGYKGRKYYIDDSREENAYCQAFLSLPPKAMEWLVKQYGVEELSDIRNVYENILPKLAKRLHLGRKWTYETLYIALYEYAATLLELPILQVYTLEALRQQMQDKKVDSEDLFDKGIIYICKHNI